MGPARPGACRARQRRRGRLDARPAAARKGAPARLLPPARGRPHRPDGGHRQAHPLPAQGEASYWTIKVGDREVANATWAYLDPLPERTDIKGYMAFYWDRVDSWWEEDDEVFVHPRDPYHRVDVLNSSRHVRVEIDGQTVADTRRPRLLFETNLPTRYYIPMADVRLDLLRPSDTVTSCPYKGQARYWAFQSGDKRLEDAAWSYPFPIPECPKIENLVAFFNERVDLYVDDELQPRPKTPWS